MSRICIIHPKRCQESAQRLANALGAHVSNPYREKRTNYQNYAVVINYGVAKDILGKLFNSTGAVNTCKNKFRTLSLLRDAHIPIPEFCIDKKAVKDGYLEGTVVCHTEQEGMQNKGIVYWDRDSDDPLPDAYLYTEYFHHKREYRVVVLNYKVVGIYIKQEVKGEWELIPLQNRGFKSIANACIQAAKAIEIDYVGFDVVANTREDFRILEANSGPIITDQVIESFKQLFSK